MSRNTPVIATLALLGALLPAAGFAQGVKAGKWTSGYGQGVVENTVRNGPGNEFTVSCDEGFSENGKLTGLRVIIRGDYPPPNSLVRVFVGEDEYQFGTDEIAGIQADNHVNADNFIALWESMISGKDMRVLFLTVARQPSR